MNYVLYQAYGKEEIAHEALFSILSVMRLEDPDISGFKIIIYTDLKALFQQYLLHYSFIEYREINQSEIREWRGKIDFVHRVKVKILQDFFSMHPDANLIYLDSDTYMLQPLSPLFREVSKGQLLMHICEGRIESQHNPIFRKIFSFIKRNKFDIESISGLKIPLSTEMWNAGVIGMNSTAVHILDSVLQLTDALYSKYPKHVMEQLAFSYFFQQKMPIKATGEVVFHYWYFKTFREHISTFLRKNEGKSAKELALLSASIAPDKMPIHKAEKKRKWWQKLLP
ncbi:MAG: hypothetical protein M3Q97_08065 [Bacteroidota bacterium]|nr:hypothetical protein [Bacteroidota bacterium]